MDIHWIFNNNNKKKSRHSTVHPNALMKFEYSLQMNVDFFFYVFESTGYLRESANEERGENALDISEKLVFDCQELE